jgi:hypothetical protein
MSRIVIVILIYHRHKPIDLNFPPTFFFLAKTAEITLTYRVDQVFLRPFPKCVLLKNSREFLMPEAKWFLSPTA